MLTNAGVANDDSIFLFDDTIAGKYSVLFASVTNMSNLFIIITGRRCGQVVCDRCSTHRANMARSQIVQDPSVPNWQQAQLATQPQRICDKCYAEMRPPSGLRSATAPPSQPQRIAGHGSSHIRRSTSSQSIMSECPVCGKRLSNVSLDKDVQEEHVQSCLNVGSPSVATVRYVCKCNNQACDLFSVRHIVITR
jgi:ribosomal protein L40E